MGEMMIVMEKIDCADPDCAGMDTNNDRLTDCDQKKGDCAAQIRFTGPARPSECEDCISQRPLVVTEYKNNECYYGDHYRSCYATEYGYADGKGNDGATLTDCADPDCCGETDVNGNVCCAGDNSRCANMDCGLYKAECSGDVRECKRECVSADDCVENACCKLGLQAIKNV